MSGLQLRAIAFSAAMCKQHEKKEIKTSAVRAGKMAQWLKILN